MNANILRKNAAFQHTSMLPFHILEYQDFASYVDGTTIYTAKKEKVSVIKRLDTSYF